MPTEEIDKKSIRIAGSFRDPSGYVFRWDGRLFRAIDRDCHQTLQELQGLGLLDQLEKDRILVTTRFVEDPYLLRIFSAEHTGYEHFLEHEEIESITYPYEWSFSMLADAAIHTLDLQLRLLEVGHSLKDATAYNIQFVEGRPIFIDIASIERPRRRDLWFALGQFSRMFTIPLLLHRHRGWDLRSYFLSHIDGRDLQQTIEKLGWLERWKPSWLLDVTFPWLLSKISEHSTNKNRHPVSDANAELSGHFDDCRSQQMNLKRLRRKIRNLAAGHKPKGIWSNYDQECNYDQQAKQSKKAFIEEFLRSVQPSHVLDIGCNTGDYSYLATRCGARVVATDSDANVVEILHRRLAEEPAPITPMVVDLTNPSPSIGFRNQERESFLKRTQSQCVLALALMHHLIVNGNLSLAAIRDVFCDLTEEYLIFEFIPTTDSMFQRLIRFRVDLYEDITVAHCRSIFSERFELLEEHEIPGSSRILFFLRKREARKWPCFRAG